MDTKYLTISAFEITFVHLSEESTDEEVPTRFAPRLRRPSTGYVTKHWTVPTSLTSSITCARKPQSQFSTAEVLKASSGQGADLKVEVTIRRANRQKRKLTIPTRADRSPLSTH